MGLFTKTRTKRVVPEERKFANAMMVREALRRITGKEDRGDMLTRQLRRGRALEDVELERRSALRDLGERGIEGPGMYNRLLESREGALGNLIAADTQAAIERRQGAVPILGTLLRENQPYTKTKTKQGALSKAKPFLKAGGAAIGGFFGGPAGAAVGMKAGETVGGLGDEQGGQGAGATAYSGAGGAGTPTREGGPPMASVNPNPQEPELPSEGGPPSASVNPDVAKKKLGMKGRLTGGLQGLLSAFGG